MGEIPGLTVYENLKNTEETIKDYSYFANKTFEAILIPEKTGSVDVPAISISYFNPVTEKYEAAEIAGVTIVVNGNMPQQNFNNSNWLNDNETLVISQVNYSDSNSEYFAIQIKKESVYIIIAIFIILFALSIFLIWVISIRKKKNTTLKNLYKQLSAATDINEIYSLFNDMIKYRYNLNLKTNSQNTVRNNLPDSNLAEKLIDIMSYMESSEAKEKKGCLYLKDNIKSIYKSTFCKT